MKVTINGHIITQITEKEVNFNYDSISDTFSFTLPHKGHEWLNPLGYYPVTIHDDSGNLLLTGQVLNHHAKSNDKASEVTISGYSVTGILGDCPNIAEAIKEGEQKPDTDVSAPDPSGLGEIWNTITGIFSPDVEPTAASSNFQGINLYELTKKVIAPFKNIGISMGYDVSDEITKRVQQEPYDQATTEPTESIGAYLSKLATLKNVVLRGTPTGNLEFTQLNENDKVRATFQNGMKCIEMSLEVNGQSMFWGIHVCGKSDLYEDQKKDKSDSGNFDVRYNPLVSDKRRETLIMQGTEVKLIKNAVDSAFADSLKGINLNIEIPNMKEYIETYHLSPELDTQYKQITALKPGDLIEVLNPEIFINHITKFMVRSISIKEDANGERETLKCIIPQMITGNKLQRPLIFS